MQRLWRRHSLRLAIHNQRVFFFMFNFNFYDRAIISEPRHKKRDYIESFFCRLMEGKKWWVSPVRIITVPINAMRAHDETNRLFLGSLHQWAFGDLCLAFLRWIIHRWPKPMFLCTVIYDTLAVFGWFKTLTIHKQTRSAESCYKPHLTHVIASIFHIIIFFLFVADTC